MFSSAMPAVLICGLSIFTTGIAARSAPDDAATGTRTMTGWFSDAQCAAPQIKKGIIAPNNPDCVKVCLRKGTPAVFISEQTKTMYEIRGDVSVAADVGWHVEVVGTIQDDGKTLQVASVKRLEEVGAMCNLPRKKTS